MSVPPMKSRVCYFYDSSIGNFYYGSGHPMKPHRLRMTHALLLAYGLYKKLEVYRPHPASKDEIESFHASDYVEFLQRVTPESSKDFLHQLQKFNLGPFTDCPVFSGMYDYCSIYTGGSIDGAMKLNHQMVDVAVNWAGGLHHAKKSEASGFCIAGGALVALAEGRSVSIETMPTYPSHIMSFHPKEDNGGSKAECTRAPFFIDQGVRECVEMVLDDGRSLVCTPDHKVGILRGGAIYPQMVAVKDLRSNDRIIVVPDSPRVEVPSDSTWCLNVGIGGAPHTFDLKNGTAMAFARIMGYAFQCDDGDVVMQHRMDMNAIVEDLKALQTNGSNIAVCSSHSPNMYHVHIPPAVSDALASVGFSYGKLPSLVFADATPTCFIQEYLGGLFGRNGRTTNLEGDHFSPISFHTSALNESLQEQMVAQMESGLGKLLRERFGFHPTVRAKKQRDGKIGKGTWQIILELPVDETLMFHEIIGFRYCVDKQTKLSVAAGWYRGVRSRVAQRKSLIELIGEECMRGDIPYGLATERVVKKFEENAIRLVGVPTISELNQGDVPSGRMAYKAVGSYLDDIGARDIFSVSEKHRNRSTLPFWSLNVVGVRSAGMHRTYDLSVENTRRFVANGIDVSNCYINDIVIAILELLKYHARVLYIDIDIHHGDGVEEAFYTTDRVMTVSFHKFGDFFPGTGDIKDDGAEKGKNYSINVPLNDGIDDRSYIAIFKPIIQKVMEIYRPGAVVLQCGADSLTGDRLGCFNLTVKGHGECVRFVKSFGLPTLVLGGGGYNIRNVSRCWAYETSVLLDNPINNNIPNNDFIQYYGPDYKLHLTPSDMANLNSKEELEKVKTKVLINLSQIVHAPSVQMHEVPPDWYLIDSQMMADEMSIDPDSRVNYREEDKRVDKENEFYDDDKDQDTSHFNDKVKMEREMEQSVAAANDNIMKEE